jgi:ribosomal-protein-alanine N-acetyltransferase
VTDTRDRDDAGRGVVVFRHLEAEDLDQIEVLEHELFGPDAWTREGFEAELFQPETREYVVGVEGDRIVAYGGIMCVPPVADIMTIGVVRDHEGRGFGRQLLGLLIEAARTRGAEDVLLEVRESNERARRLYELNGFTPIHVRTKYYRDGSDAVIMQKVLNHG